MCLPRSVCYYLFAVITLFTPLTLQAKSSQVLISADLATPVLQANKAQTAYVKVALTGFAVDNQSDLIQQRPLANVAIVIDRSGSMSGQKLEQAKQAAVMAINLLSKDDVVSVVSYDDTVRVVVPAALVTNKQAIESKIRAISAGGRTALFAGVSKAAFEVRKYIKRNGVNRVVLISDGLANVGPQSASELGQLGMSLGKEGITVTTVGLGLGYNEDLMTQLAGYSDGNHTFVENAEQLANIFQKEFGNVLAVVAKDVDITITCLPGVKPIAVVGRDSEVIGQIIHTRFNQLYSNQEKYIIVEVEVPGRSVNSTMEVVDVDVKYNNLYAKRTDTLNTMALASFSQSTQDIKQAINANAYEDAIEQVANEVSEKAIQLRDDGDISGAQQLLQSNSSFLEESATVINSGKLRSQSEEMKQDAGRMRSEQQWNKNRKAMKAKQYQRENQQSYQ